MVEGHKDQVLPEIFAKGLLRNLHNNSPLQDPDLGDPEAVTKALINISKSLGIDPPATTYEKLDEWLEVQEMTNGLGASEEEDPDRELTEEEWARALRLGEEAEKRGAERWGQFGIPPDKLISPN